MQTAFFDLSYPHIVLEARRNQFPKGILHPGRVMSAHDFIYILAGEWNIVLEGTLLTAHKDDAVVLPAGHYHWGEQPCTDGTATIYVHTSVSPSEQPDTAPAAEPRRHTAAQTPSMENAAENILSLHTIIRCAEREQVRNDFEQLADAFSMKQPNRQYRLTNLLHRLLFDLQEAQTAAQTPEVLFSDAVNRCFLQHPERFFSNGELAQQMGMCEKSFTEKYRRLTGITPYRHQMRLKLEQVRAALQAYPEIRLKELATTYGFCDEYHLSKAFKKQFGISPAVYRRPFRLSRAANSTADE